MRMSNPEHPHELPLDRPQFPASDTLSDNDLTSPETMRPCNEALSPFACYWDNTANKSYAVQGEYPPQMASKTAKERPPLAPSSPTRESEHSASSFPQIPRAWEDCQLPEQGFSDMRSELCQTFKESGGPDRADPMDSTALTPLVDKAELYLLVQSFYLAPGRKKLILQDQSPTGGRMLTIMLPDDWTTGILWVATDKNVTR